MKRRLNMTAGLIHRPRLVLLDEPTVGVDPQSRNRIFEMVEALRAEGTTIIYTTHYMKEAERLCDTIGIIDHGQIIALGAKEALVAQAFGSRSSVTMHFDRHQTDAKLADKATGIRAWCGENPQRPFTDGVTAVFGSTRRHPILRQSAFRGEQSPCARANHWQK